MIVLAKLDRSTNATVRWLSGTKERARVIRISGEQAYVQWPASIRTVRRGDGEFVTGIRPPGWMPANQVSMDISASVSSGV